MKKVGVLILLCLVLSLGFVSSASNDTDEKAIACLKSKLGNNCANSDSIEQLSFSLLAMSSDSSIQSNCKSALNSKGTECFPSSNCRIKDTALALLALDNLGFNTDKIENWLISKNKTSDLEWYLEIDSSSRTTCKITHDSIQNTIIISDDKKVSGNPGNCLSLAYDNYWLKINSNCLNKKFIVSCDKDFISTLLYKKAGSNIWHVSSDVKSASTSGTTEHEINSYCFGLTSCNYEDNLWAVLALQKSGRDIKAYLPYLISYSQDNTKHSSDALLYYITNSNEYLTNVLLEQKSQGYWDLSSSQGKFYDTALALLAVSDNAEDKAKNWLKENQGNDGCWNSGNIRDTAILLWAGWPKIPSTITEIPACEGVGYCMTSGECYDASGTILKNYDCSGQGGIKVCCDKPKQEKTCSQENGIICKTGEICSVSLVSTSDTAKCCKGTCEPEIVTSECEKAGYNCRGSCLDEEESSLLSCQSGKTCCKEKIQEATSYWWLWLLIILIILVVLVIIFRKRIQVWWFKRKHKVGESGVQATRPGFPPFPGLRPMMPRPSIPTTRPVVRPAKPASKTDKELEDTLKKLKEMSK